MDKMNDTAAPEGGAKPEDLMHLAREADMLDAAPEREAQAGAQAQAQEVAQSNQMELLGALQTVRAMVLPMLAMAVHPAKVQQLGQVWNDGVLEASATAGAQVMARHGWTISGAFDAYGPYIALVAAVAPPALATRAILAAPNPKAGEGAADGAGQQQ